MQLPFLPLWLAAKGLDAGAIGIVLSVPMVVRVAAIPLATRSADRHDALRAAMVIASALALIGYAAMGLVQGAVAITIAFALASVFYAPLMPLSDAYALRGLAALGRAYGPVRLWGSAAFIAGSLGAGLLLDVLPARDLIWLVVGALAIAAAAACALSPLGLRRGIHLQLRPLRLKKRFHLFNSGRIRRKMSITFIIALGNTTAQSG